MEQVIIGGVYNLLHTTNTEYSIIAGDAYWYTDKEQRAQMISTSGKLKNLRVELNDVPGTGTYKFTLHRAVGLGVWANTALTCTVAADGTTASDMVNEVAVAAGDVVCLECDPDAPDNARYAKWTMVFEGDTANESLLLAHTTVDTAFIRYCRPMGGHTSSVAENSVRCVCPTGGTIKNLYVQLSAAPGSGDEAFRFTLRIDKTNSDDGEGNPLQCTITAGDRTGNDTTHEITVVAGKILTVMIEPLNTPSNFSYVSLGMTFVADTDGESLILGGSSDYLSDTATEYNCLITETSVVWTATEAERYQLAQICALKNLYVLLSHDPDIGKKYTFTVRKNTASPASGLVVEIAGYATTGNDTTHTITVANDDELDMMVVPDSTPDAAQAFFGLVCYPAPPPPPPPPAVTTPFSVDPKPRTRMKFYPTLGLG